MSIDWNSFTPWAALSGGVLIAASSAMLVLLNGRVAGISGIVGGLVNPVKGDTAWRAAFVIGLLLAPTAYLVVAALPRSQIDASWPMLLVAGLLVGIGTRYAAGCTSGHGVSGLSRLSPRSLAATMTFMGAGVVTVFIARHLLGA